MKILVTGAKGFIGRNLIAQLKNRGYKDILLYDIDSEDGLLDEYAASCEFVFHLAGINRPKEQKEFMEGNFGFTATLLEALKRNQSHAPVLVTSSIQADLDNPYGQSKRAGENLIFDYGKETGNLTYVYRLPNVFGKWCRPNYNSVVATFCNNIAHDLPIVVHDPEVILNLVYIDDVVTELICALEGNAKQENQFCIVEPVHRVKLGEIADLLYSFKESRKNLEAPNMGSPFIKKLYSTYLSYLSEEDFAYPLTIHADQRGSFTEFIRTNSCGQFSINISHPGITKGNHWHNTKNEKFLVISGQGVIRFRKIDEQRIIEYNVSGDKMQVVDIPVGYTHSITNTGNSDMVTVMWANECFDPEHPDTYFLEVTPK
ncbi:capsular polysaccharide biosynthesis protein CapF [Gehongia tenuis]|uniref:Capsular polysaccharide biosynthesis protein CapF n=1 Tax=Gehongia tenuis TaxID=2763655 RepID=A0A926D8J6_9FIRM|nr:capsular polysaccharide biosynthesis protein CapF [Gehongia tenuis]MBC8532365.1 capsular polysaccharide biosynthesis protein CapF [Gehongia tenuis]